MSASLRIAADLFRRLPGHRCTLGLAAGAVGVATTVLLLVASALAGIEVRAEREAWLEPRAGAPIAAQVTSTQFLDHRPVTIVRLAPATVANAVELPTPPGLDRFPRPGELALSPALAEALRGRADVLGLGSDPAAAILIGPEALGGPDDLLAVVGHRPGDSPMTAPPVRDITGLTRFVGPVEIDSFVGIADRDVASNYRSAVLVAGALLVVPATGLVAAAAGLGARSRAGRIARLRLAGTPRGVLTRLRVLEALAIGGIGVAAGVVLHWILLPAVARIPLAGSRFVVTDLIVPLPSTVLIATGVVGALLLRLLTLTSRAVQEPLATADALPTTLPVLWRLGLTGIAILGLVVANQQPDPSLFLLLTALLLAFGTVSVLGPIAVAAVGRLLLVGPSAASLIAGRRLAADPRAGWRPISGVALAGFIAGLLAFGVFDTTSVVFGQPDTLDVLVPTSSASAVVDELHRTRPSTAPELSIVVDPRPAGAVSLLSLGDRPATTLRIAGDGHGLRAAVQAAAPGAPMASGIDIREVHARFPLDAQLGSAVVLVTTFLLAIATLAVTAVTATSERRETYRRLRAAGTPVEVLLGARSREQLGPLVVCTVAAAAAGVVVTAPVVLAAGPAPAVGAVRLVATLFVGVGAAFLALRATATRLQAESAPSSTEGTP